MRLSATKVKKVCNDKGLLLKEALAGAGVSRTAYYSLLDNETVLPRSVVALADFLELPPSALLEETVGPRLQALGLLRDLERVLAEFPEADRDNVRHTLLLLNESPADRLERGLTRGRALRLYR